MIIFIGLLILAYIMGGITMVIIENTGNDEEGEEDEE